MKAIKEFLLNTLKFDNSDINKKIAKNLLESYNTDKYLSLKELSLKSYCSESAITKFCKKIELSGYKELIICLQIEKEKYLRNNVENISFGQNYIFDYLDFIKSEITLNRQWIENFKISLQEKKKLYIFSCYQLMDIANFFREYSEFKGTRTIFSAIRHFEGRSIQNAISENNSIILIFLSGQDNNWLIDEIYSVIKKNRNSKDIYIISSKSQSNKIEQKNLYQLNSYKMYSGYEYRRIYLDILCLTIFEDYKRI
ncbi:hypothetical protein [Spiroplasma culicicola]|uniref:HTH rpiR-type domain-containing protein n=1 Tax=Spiroplasma culicicola AES-1 TaxID=1276246 RepID=W6A7H3_9MOLU|nr:hypothetical protein [Spiroplasma culicicola]AHI52795.1 hypothetical protein SCULI_v1c04540 [Spiroplasma culicicola AES-1]